MIKRALINFTSSDEILLDNQISSIDELLTNNIQNIYVTTGPGGYTRTRKALSICKAISLINKTVKIFGINLLTDFLYHFNVHCAYIEKKIAWYIDQNKNIYLTSVDQVPLIKVANFATQHNNQIILCTTQNIWTHLDIISTSKVEQVFFDKFSK